ncbi:MAG: phytoene desaturase, partial [Parvularculaceae bacterium]
EELWTLAGRRMADDLDLRAMNPFYRIRFDDGTVMNCSADLAATRAEIARIAPDDVAGYDRFMVKSEEICRIGFEQLGHVPFGSILDMIRVAPDLIRLSGHHSVHHLVSRYVKDERLR